MRGKSKVLQEVRPYAGRMIKTSKELCESCIYSVTFGANYSVCDYLEKTGKSRGCKAGECDKYEKRKGKRKGA